MDRGLSAKQSDVESVEVLPREDFASWDHLVESSPHGTIFHSSWWLQASEQDFEILVCRDKEGSLLAGIPLPRQRRSGLTLFQSHILTPYLGPIFDLSNASKNFQKFTRMRRLGECLGRSIRGFDLLSYGVAPTGPDLQGFLWAGFRVTVALYTFRFEAGSSIDRILEQIAPRQRLRLSSALRHHRSTLEVGDNIDAFLALNKQTFERQGMAMPWEESVVRRLLKAARARGQADIYLCRTLDGVYAAGLVVVWDKRTSYGLLAGGNPEVRRFGGFNLVLWQAIQDALRAGRAFDFEGSTFPPVERYVRDWGAEAKPVFGFVKTGTFKGYMARVFRRIANIRSNTKGQSR